MNAEQLEEFEVLQSIFPDTFEGMDFLFYVLLILLDRSVTVASSMAASHRIRYDQYCQQKFHLLLFVYVALLLTANITDAYPHEAPEVYIECTRGKYPDMGKLKTDLKDEVCHPIFTYQSLIIL